MASLPRRNAAVFIDMENMFGGYGGDVESVPLRLLLDDICAVMRKLDVGDEFAVAKAYGNWSKKGMSTYRPELLKRGIEPVQVFSVGGEGSPKLKKCQSCGTTVKFTEPPKNAADIELVVDTLTTAAQCDWLDVFVLATGDGDFVPLVRRLHTLGKYVIGATLAGRTRNGILRAAVDTFHVVGSAIPKRKEAAGTDAGSKITSPTITEVRAFVATLLLKDAGVSLSNGGVNESVLLERIRTRWPDLSLDTLGIASVTSLVDAARGSEPLAAPATPDAATSSEAATATIAPKLAAYREMVREVFTNPHARQQIHALVDDDGALSVHAVTNLLTRSGSYVSYKNTAMPSFATALQYSLANTEYQVIMPGDSKNLMVCRRAASRDHALPDLTDADLTQADYLRRVLAAAAKPLRFDHPHAIVSLARFVAQHRPGGTAYTQVLGDVTEALPHLEAEQLRQALRLFVEARVLVGLGSEDEDTRIVIVDPELHDAAEILDRLRNEAAERLARIGWPYEDTSLLELVPRP